MDGVLRELGSALSLTEEEDDDIVLHRDLPPTPGNLDLTLVGRLLSHRPTNFDALSRTFFTLLRLAEGVNIQLVVDNRFIDPGIHAPYGPWLRENSFGGWSTSDTFSIRPAVVRPFRGAHSPAVSHSNLGQFSIPHWQFLAQIESLTRLVLALLCLTHLGPMSPLRSIRLIKLAFFAAQHRKLATRPIRLVLISDPFGWLSPIFPRGSLTRLILIPFTASISHGFPPVVGVSPSPASNALGYSPASVYGVISSLPDFSLGDSNLFEVPLGDVHAGGSGAGRMPPFSLG
ncbi:hypothetical protein Salat_0883200 [Sesamum alatum]|uniref:Uncharacterized protein n=1 Tax=Sesamum alatum TaxID=300844 RepID=A0AAE2CQV7_9LAMI|nr:hypothetical protein Salat_0883200 [Sesamum alatum]